MVIRYNNCIRCNSDNIEKLSVNTHIALTTDAILCKDCGHIELFIDFTKQEHYI